MGSRVYVGMKGVCDACGKPRRIVAFAVDGNGEPDVGICWLCVKESERKAARDRAKAEG